MNTAAIPARVAIVTGASRGIGAAAFARMRQQGAGFDTHLRQNMACYGQILRPAG